MIIEILIVLTAVTVMVIVAKHFDPDTTDHSGLPDFVKQTQEQFLMDCKKDKSKV
jgi:hypothetical protein